VSKLVKSGRSEEALRAVRGYRSRYERLNEKVQSQVVADNLTEVGELERSVEEHEAGKKELDSLQLKHLRALGYMR
jgi:hypothetical protein